MNIRVDPKDRAKFKFGNGGVDMTKSRATLHMIADDKTGEFKIYSMDTKGKFVPLLGGMEFLVRAGAVIDFETGASIFKKINPDKVVVLERISSGHLVFPLCSDVYEQECADLTAAAAVKDLAARQAVTE